MPPSGVERCTPHNMVPAPLRCPQEAVLPTPLPLVARGAAVSSKLLTQGPPQYIALGLHPLRKVKEQSSWLFLASSLQVTEVAVLSTPETSLERLISLVDVLIEWRLLPNVSQRVLQPLEKGYRIHFGYHPPIQWAFNHVSTPQAGTCDRTRNKISISKESY